jgi:hypothetical protein
LKINWTINLRTPSVGGIFQISRLVELVALDHIPDENARFYLYKNEDLFDLQPLPAGISYHLTSLAGLS